MTYHPLGITVHIGKSQWSMHPYTTYIAVANHRKLDMNLILPPSLPASLSRPLSSLACCLHCVALIFSFLLLPLLVIADGHKYIQAICSASLSVPSLHVLFRSFNLIVDWLPSLGIKSLKYLSQSDLKFPIPCFSNLSLCLENLREYFNKTTLLRLLLCWQTYIYLWDYPLQGLRTKTKISSSACNKRNRSHDPDA